MYSTLEKKRLLLAVKTCRACKKAFRPIKGNLISDHCCCSEKCFITVPRLPLEPVIPVTQFVKPSKSRRERHRKQQKRERVQSKGFFDSDDWRALRYKFLEMRGKECMHCGQTSGSMYVSHLQHRNKRPDLALSFDNVQILCKICDLGKTANAIDFKSQFE